MNWKQNLLEFIDDRQVTFGYMPRGEEDWYVSIKELKEFIDSQNTPSVKENKQ
jgi:hypothetical protein